MQKRLPVGGGPSSKTWPRWDSASEERTSVRGRIALQSVRSYTAPGSSGFVKLGQPVPDSNLSSELNSGSPETTST